MDTYNFSIYICYKLPDIILTYSALKYYSHLHFSMKYNLKSVNYNTISGNLL